MKKKKMFLFVSLDKRYSLNTFKFDKRRDARKREKKRSDNKKIIQMIVSYRITYWSFLLIIPKRAKGNHAEKYENLRKNTDEQRNFTKKKS